MLPAIQSPCAGMDVSDSASSGPEDDNNVAILSLMTGCFDCVVHDNPKSRICQFQWTASTVQNLEKRKISAQGTKKFTLRNRLTVNMGFLDLIKAMSSSVVTHT